MGNLERTEGTQVVQMTRIEFPYIRMNVVGALEMLANEIVHRTGTPPPGEFVSFDEAVHILFDDTGISEDPFAVVGTILYNAQEAECLALVCNSIDEMLQALGTDLSDEDYYKSRYWDRVYVTASRALRLLEENDQSQAGCPRRE